MPLASLHTPAPRRGLPRLSLMLGPAAIIFLCYNVVNAGNLAFNMLFSRWMGPALFGDLAIILTVKLSILSVFTAVQMAVSRHVAAKGRADDAALARINRIGFGVLALALGLVLLAVWLTDLGRHLGMGTPGLLLLILLVLPLALPLGLIRGVVQGRMDVGGVLASALVEMGVRLFGAILMWQMGAGIIGATLAIVLSVVAGWAVIARRLSSAPTTPANPALPRLILIACLPFALLQLSQVLLLDAELFVAKLMFNAEQAGYFAATSLFQRIEFFACFGLVSVLLPSVARAVAQGGTGLAEARPVALLYLLVTGTVLSVIALFPDALIHILFGPAFLSARDLLFPAGLAAAAFTFSFLVATFLAGLGSFAGIWLVAACVPVQLGAFALAPVLMPAAPQPTDLMLIKALCQGGLALLMAATVCRHVLRPHPTAIVKE